MCKWKRDSEKEEHEAAIERQETEGVKIYSIDFAQLYFSSPSQKPGPLERLKRNFFPGS
jgi:hypothetical protein